MFGYPRNSNRYREDIEELRARNQALERIRAAKQDVIARCTSTVQRRLSRRSDVLLRAAPDGCRRCADGLRAQSRRRSSGHCDGEVSPACVPRRCEEPGPDGVPGGARSAFRASQAELRPGTDRRACSPAARVRKHSARLSTPLCPSKPSEQAPGSGSSRLKKEVSERHRRHQADGPSCAGPGIRQSPSASRAGRSGTCLHLVHGSGRIEEPKTRR